MTDLDELRRPTGHVGQATTVEQHRAIAEVMAAVRLAQEVPRDEATAIRALAACTSRRSLAERAFYTFPRGGEDGTVRGTTVHLAREAARCWGNIHTALHELVRDDERGQSEMQVVAWDLQANARVAHTFIVPHVRDTKAGPRQLRTMRDLYENNANVGARRLRAAIFAVLPGWYLEQAEDDCRATLAKPPEDDKRPLQTRIAACLDRFGELGVTRGQLETHAGRPTAQWTELDLSDMLITYRSLRTGEITRDEAFPPAVVTVAEIVRAAPDGTPALGTRGQRRPAGRAGPSGGDPADPSEPDGGWPETRQPPPDTHITGQEVVTDGS
jgi:hypothetical protein